MLRHSPDLVLLIKTNSKESAGIFLLTYVSIHTAGKYKMGQCGLDWAPRARMDK